MPHSAARALVIAYGNPHRQDDRVGHVIADAVRTWADETGIAVDVLAAYQLDVDMIEQIGAAALVVFVDAHRREFSEEVVCQRVEPQADAGFTTHAFTPAGLMALAKQMIGAAPRAFIVSVPGYAFDMGDELSERTRTLAVDAIARVQQLVVGV